MTALTDQEPQPTQRQQPRRRRSSCSHESILSDLFSEAASISSGRFLSSGCADDSVVGSLVDVNIHDDGERFDEEVAHGQQDVIIEVASKKSDHHGMFDVHSVSEPIESQQSQSATAIRTDRPTSSQPSSQGSSALFGLDTPMDQNISLLADTDANANPLDDMPSTSVTTATAPDATTNTFAPSTSASLSPLPPLPEQHFADQETTFPLDRLPSATSASFTYPSLSQVSGVTSHTCTYATFKERRRRSEQNERVTLPSRGDSLSPWTTTTAMMRAVHVTTRMTHQPLMIRVSPGDIYRKKKRPLRIGAGGKI